MTMWGRRGAALSLQCDCGKPRRHGLKVIIAIAGMEGALPGVLAGLVADGETVVHGGLLATLTAWCEQNVIPYQGVPVGTIKRFIAGKGNADKDAVIAAVQSRGQRARGGPLHGIAGEIQDPA